MLMVPGSRYADAEKGIASKSNIKKIMVVNITPHKTFFKSVARDISLLISNHTTLYWQ